MAYIGTQLVIATFCIFVFHHKRVEGRHVDKITTDSIGEILPFWEPDPRFMITSSSIRRDNNVNEHFKFRYDKGNRDQFNKFSNSSSASDSGGIGLRADPDGTDEVNGTRGRRAQATPNHRSTRYTPVALRQVVDEQIEATYAAFTRTPAPKEKPVHKDKKDKEEETDDYDDSFVLTVYEMGQQFKTLLSEYPNVNVSSEVLTRTASYNDILLLRISSTAPSKYFRADEIKYVQEVSEKKIIFIVHALNSMGLGKLYSLTVERYLRELLSYYLAHLDKFDIFLMPMANPDGYVKVKLSDFWNKNTSPQPACAGVALDRNFDVAWNSSRQISSCSQHYPGPRPFSEPESAAVGDILHKYSHKIVAYFHVHAGQYDTSTFRGDAVLYPRGFTDVQSSDDDKYVDIKADIDEAMKNANFKTMSVTVDTLYNWYGKISGSSVDYASAVYGVPFAMELVMQLYQDPSVLNEIRMTRNIDELEFYALTEIWKRVINVIFMNIWKKSTNIEQDFNEVNNE